MDNLAITSIMCLKSYRGPCSEFEEELWSGYQPSLSDKGPRVANWRLRIDLLQQRGDGEEEGKAEADSVRTVQEEEMEANITGSEEMELNISLILEKIENFTQRVSELLESGKTMFKELSNEFEEKLIMIHKEQVEKWQEEIKELRAIDASNEEANAVLHNARYLLQLNQNDYLELNFANKYRTDSSYSPILH
ncbi:hypothetical protein Ahy_A09g045076 isoform C [Arachis hypogaea]|nr:hypothetical protein Ahy_A09g045076 isoform C [Arachis hypogaea]